MAKASWEIPISFPTPESRSNYMDLIMNTIEDGIFMAKDRWADEKKYEDFNDYIKVVQEWLKEINPGIKLVAMTKKFVLCLEIPGFPYKPYIKYKSQSVEWSSKPLK